MSEFRSSRVEHQREIMMSHEKMTNDDANCLRSKYSAVMNTGSTARTFFETEGTETTIDLAVHRNRIVQHIN